MVLDDTGLNEALAQIYAEIHVAATGKSNHNGFTSTSLTKEQTAIITPIGKH